MRVSRVVLVLASFLAFSASAYCANDCLSDIYKSVESGKQFHPLWPFISGTQVVGTVVIASNPKKPEAYFGSIDAPDYRPIGATSFPIKQIQFTTPTSCSSANAIGADVAFSQLDALSTSLSKGPSASSLTGSSSASAQTPAAQGAGTTNPSNPPGAQGAGTTNSPNPPAQPTPLQQVNSDQYRTSTGVDFSHIKSATLKITGLSIQYYDLPILVQLNSGKALNPTGAALLTNKQNGWIVSRALVAQTVEYTLTSDSDINASFLAQLIQWLPGVKFKYASARTVDLTTTAPVTIGYKLWQRGVSYGGASTNACSQYGCEFGASEIDATVFSSK